MRIDLNADLGEEVTDDGALLRVVTSANVACGFHAGTPAIMRAVCAEARRRGVVIGAQVSYDDRPGFGRRPREVDSVSLTEQVAVQVETLRSIAESEGTGVSYLKPHGALYHRVLDDEQQAAAVLAGSGALPVLTLPDSVLGRLARSAGRRVLHEGFPDRGYTPEGRLLPRSDPQALVTDPEQVAANAVRLAGGGPDGASQPVDSVCVHGDSPGAVVVAQRVRNRLAQSGFDVISWRA